jgi:hypothetical protein
MWEVSTEGCHIYIYIYIYEFLTGNCNVINWSSFKSLLYSVTFSDCLSKKSWNKANAIFEDIMGYNTV